MRLSCLPNCAANLATELVSMPCFFCSVGFVPPQGNFLIFNEAIRIHTLDGGATYEQDPHNAGERIKRVIRTNDGTRLIAVTQGGNPAKLMTSDDEGLTWTERLAPVGFSWSVATKLFEQDGKYYFGTGNGNLNPPGYVSTDNGTTWTGMTDVANSNAWLYPYPGDRLLYSGAGNTEAEISSDDGVTWTPFTLPNGLHSAGAVFETPNSNWVIIDQTSPSDPSTPGVQWSDNDGATWNIVDVTETLSQNSVQKIAFVPFLNKIVASRGSNQLLVGSPDGKEWEVVILDGVSDYVLDGDFTVTPDSLVFTMDNGDNVARVTSLWPVLMDVVSTGIGGNVSGLVEAA